MEPPFLSLMVAKDYCPHHFLLISLYFITFSMSPYISYDLLSINKLTSNNYCSISFDVRSFTINNLSTNPVLLCKRSRNFYRRRQLPVQCYGQDPPWPSQRRPRNSCALSEEDADAAGERIERISLDEEDIETRVSTAIVIIPWAGAALVGAVASGYSALELDRRVNSSTAGHRQWLLLLSAVNASD
ncbi:hypothetical protein M5K25_011744 [Dendrobium thyrsiflorum]|uniref:Uncharacterized protein n=1 Tax=Dendrobium thyrsiflorum TaxID=117978 RepID=A0ABD0V3N5_DENTH